MKKLFFSLMLPALLGGSSLPGFGQAPAWQNALDTPGVFNSTSSGSSVSAMTTDASGNVYVAGLFVGALTLGNLSLPSSNTGFPSDAFVAKWLPATRTFAWVARLASVPRSVTAGTYGANIVVQSLVVSGTSIYVGGNFAESSIIVGNTTLANAGGNSRTRDGFLAKLTDAGSNASFAWAQRLGGPGDDGVNGVVANGQSIYAAGVFRNTATGIGTAALTSAGGADIFVMKLTDNGGTTAPGWAQRLGGTGDDGAAQLALAGNSLYMVGDFSNTVSFGSTSLISAGSSDGFVAKMTDAGSTAAIGWVQRLGSTGSDYVTDLVPNGNSLYLTGGFEAIVPVGTNTLVSAGGGDGFVAKLTDGGSTSTFAWARSMGGLREDGGARIAARGGKVYVAGNWGDNGGGTASAPAAFGATTLQSVGGQDAFVAKLTDTGSTTSFTWVQQAGSADGDHANALVISGTSVYAGGNFSGLTITLGNQTLFNPQDGNSDGFFASLTDLTLPTRAAALPAAVAAYPNPTAERTTLTVPREWLGQGYAVRDCLGRELRRGTLAAEAQPLDLGGLPAGVYVVQLGDEARQTLRVVKQ